ncbi:MAG: TetR/AcrR family transcriptional regulator [Acidimicrobiia bacterium]
MDEQATKTKRPGRRTAASAGSDVSTADPNGEGDLAIDRGNASGRATRELLVRTAERLFAERGIAAVSLREVGQAAGQRNNAATQYHFRDRSGLVRAVFQYRVPELNDGRLKLLAALDERGEGDDPIALVGAMIASMAEHLTDDDNHYVGFYARYQVEHGGMAWEDDITPWQAYMGSYHLLHERLRGLTPHLSDEVFEHRYRLVNEWLIYALSHYRRSLHRRRDLKELDAYCADLTQTLWAALSAPS